MFSVMNYHLPLSSQRSAIDRSPVFSATLRLAPSLHIRLLLTRSFPLVSPLQGCLRQSPERLPSPPRSLRLCAIARVFRFQLFYFRFFFLRHQQSVLRPRLRPLSKAIGRRVLRHQPSAQRSIHQPILTIPFTESKCRSWDTIGKRCCLAKAAIQQSFAGIGVPAFLSRSRTSA